MFESAIRVNGFMLDYARRLMADIPPDQLGHAPAPGVHTPRWIIGHLIFAADRGLMRTGGTPRCDDAWFIAFGPGSPGDGAIEPAPTKDALLARLNEAYAAFHAAARKADPDAMNKPHGVELFKGSPLETVGDTVVHLLTSHVGVHLGQLSMWRRLTGRAPLF